MFTPAGSVCSPSLGVHLGSRKAEEPTNSANFEKGFCHVFMEFRVSFVHRTHCTTMERIKI